MHQTVINPYPNYTKETGFVPINNLTDSKNKFTNIPKFRHDPSFNKAWNESSGNNIRGAQDNDDLINMAHIGKVNPYQRVYSRDNEGLPVMGIDNAEYFRQTRFDNPTIVYNNLGKGLTPDNPDKELLRLSVDPLLIRQNVGINPERLKPPKIAKRSHGGFLLNESWNRVVPAIDVGSLPRAIYRDPMTPHMQPNVNYWLQPYSN